MNLGQTFCLQYIDKSLKKKDQLIKKNKNCSGTQFYQTPLELPVPWFSTDSTGLLLPPPHCYCWRVRGSPEGECCKLLKSIMCSCWPHLINVASPAALLAWLCLLRKHCTSISAWNESRICGNASRDTLTFASVFSLRLLIDFDSSWLCVFPRLFSGSSEHWQSLNVWPGDICTSDETVWLSKEWHLPVLWMWHQIFSLLWCWKAFKRTLRNRENSNLTGSVIKEIRAPCIRSLAVMVCPWSPAVG